MQELLAAQHGMVVLPRVTKALDILVVADGELQTGKTEASAKYGTTIIGEVDAGGRVRRRDVALRHGCWVSGHLALSGRTDVPAMLRVKLRLPGFCGLAPPPGGD